MHPRPPSGQGLPPGSGELLLEDLVGHLALGHCGLTSQSQGFGSANGLEPAVDLGVGAADEERGHPRHRRQVALAGLQAAKVGLDDLGVAGQGEQKGHVDTAPFGRHGLDGRQALSSARNLHVQIGAVNALAERPGRGQGALGVAGQLRIDLHRDEAVDAVAGLMNRGQRVEGAADVGEHELPVGIGDAQTVGQQPGELLVILGSRGHGLLEDAGIGGEPPHPALNPAGQFPVVDPLPAQIVQPGTLAVVAIQVVEAAHCRYS